MLDLRRLEVLQRFALLGTISATAADLGYSPSAISQQLSALEREAGIALIERTAHSAGLTGAGHELVRHAGVILGAVEEAQARMRTRSTTVAGHVIVSCIPGLAARLAPHLATAQRDHPGLSVTAHETSSSVAATAVLDRRTDLAVVDHWTRRPASPGSGLQLTRLHREQVVLAVPVDHPLAARSEQITDAGLREIADSGTWLCAPAGHLSRAAGDARLDEIGARPGRRWEFEGLDVLAALVATGAGVALLPAAVVQANPGTRAVGLKKPMYRWILALTRSTIRHDPALGACLAAAGQLFSQAQPQTGASPITASR